MGRTVGDGRHVPHCGLRSVSVFRSVERGPRCNIALHSLPVTLPCPGGRRVPVAVLHPQVRWHLLLSCGCRGIANAMWPRTVSRCTGPRTAAGRCCQCVGPGHGLSVRVVCQFLPPCCSKVVLIPTPTWANHRFIFEKCGLEVRQYRCALLCGQYMCALLRGGSSVAHWYVGAVQVLPLMWALPPALQPSWAGARHRVEVQTTLPDINGHSPAWAQPSLRESADTACCDPAALQVLQARDPRLGLRGTPHPAVKTTLGWPPQPFEGRSGLMRAQRGQPGHSLCCSLLLSAAWTEWLQHFF